MTATYDPAKVERLVREAREDDGAMLAAFREFGDSYLILTKHGAYGTHAVVTALERLAAVADQLEAARAQVAELEAAVKRMAPVVAAADAWRSPDAGGDEHDRLVDAVDAYRAKIRGTG